MRGNFNKTSGRGGVGARVGVPAGWDQPISVAGAANTTPLPAGWVKGSDEQEAVWDVLLNQTQHLIVEAVAGSGKTFTIVQYALRESKRRVGLVAFNKHIADELRARVGGKYNVDCMTYHSLGFKTVRAAVRGARCEVDQYKVHGIVEGYRLPGSIPSREQKNLKYRVVSMVAHSKALGLGPEQADETALDYIVERFDVDLEGHKEFVYDLVPKVLRRCMDELGTVDYDDMVWLPHVMGWRPAGYDVLCVDEYQDTGLTQQSLALNAAKRLCAVGDPKQAIYAFRGADSKGFERLREKLGAGVVTLPLTLTRRCPQSHVRLAQTIVPQIRALEDAPEGKVRLVVKLDDAVAEMRPGDLVVCRVNAELVGTAYKLLKRDVPAFVRGRDLGEGLKKLIEQAERQVGGDRPTLPEVLKVAGDVTEDQIRKFMAEPHGKGEARAGNAQDRYDCLSNLAEQCKDVAELKGVIAKLFEDGDVKNAVVLGTVHRTKGLEGNRVYVLRPDLIPHPMAKKEADKEGERNLAYVAVTRAKFNTDPDAHEIVRGIHDCKCGERDNAPVHQMGGELVFVGCECPLFPLTNPDTPDAPDHRLAEAGVIVDEDPFGVDEPLERAFYVEEAKDGGESSDFITVRDTRTGEWRKEKL